MSNLIAEFLQLESWTPNDIPDLRGKVALVTGGNGSIGFHTCRKLAENNCKVYLTARDTKKGHDAVERIRADYKAAKVEYLICDTSDFRSVEQCVKDFKSKNEPLHILVCNAGTFFPGAHNMTAEGFEYTLATNYWGHAYMVFQLLDKLVHSGAGSRIVLMASTAEQYGKLDWFNLKGERFKDSGLVPYGTSKLFLLMFGSELQERLRRDGKEVDVFGVHPGLVNTSMVGKLDVKNYISSRLIGAAARLVGLPEPKGAYSTLYAATAPELSKKGFLYLGPNYLFNMWHTQPRRPYNRYFYNAEYRRRLFDDTITILRETLGHQPPNADLVGGPTSIFAARGPRAKPSSGLGKLTAAMSGASEAVTAKTSQVVGSVRGTLGAAPGAIASSISKAVESGKEALVETTEKIASSAEALYHS